MEIKIKTTGKANNNWTGFFNYLEPAGSLVSVWWWAILPFRLLLLLLVVLWSAGLLLGRQILVHDVRIVFDHVLEVGVVL